MNADDQPALSKSALLRQLGVSERDIEDVCSQYGIKRLTVFGSAARGEMRPDSDVDLMIEYSMNVQPSLGDLAEARDAFMRLFGGRDVDLTTPSILRNPYRRKAIEREKRELYAA